MCIYIYIYIYIYTCVYIYIYIYIYYVFVISARLPPLDALLEAWIQGDLRDIIYLNMTWLGVLDRYVRQSINKQFNIHIYTYIFVYDIYIYIYVYVYMYI